jgi:Ankyrin repeats (3 copies)
MSPQEFLNALIQDGDLRRAKYYSTESYSVKESAYYNQPTTFQLMSYGSHLTDMIRRSNAHALRDLLVSCSNKEGHEKLGLSPNACNVYGESILTMICRRGDLKLLQVLMDTGCCSLQVSDDCGRTPLHDACWTSSSQPCFEVVEIILQADARLLYMKDARGALPLDYVPKQHWDAWKRFLVRVVLDAYFPILDNDNGDEQHDADKKQGPPELTKYSPNSRPVSTPPNSLPNALAAMVAFGKLTPDEARMMAAPDDDDDDYTDDDDSDNDHDDEATVGSSTSNCDEDDVDDEDDDSSSSSSSSSGSSSSSSSDGEDYDSYSDDDEEVEDDDFAVNNNPDEEDMDQAVVMTGSLLTGKLLL